MKKAFVNALIELYKREPFFFLTGDLGFNMLEPLRDVMGERFINAGCAEQNMVSMAAGIASTGEQVFVYSIAPFLYARAFEQIRNDVCFHNLPVCLVGMGGGYHYGNLGPSHWALEDYGTLLALPNMRCYIPAFKDDIVPQLERIIERKAPSYWRLGRCERPDDVENRKYQTVRMYGSPEYISCGAIAGMLLHHKQQVAVISELEADEEYLSDNEEWMDVRRSAIVVEEHVRQGGLGQLLICRSVNAQHFTSGPYGSQDYMRRRAGLTIERIRKCLSS